MRGRSGAPIAPRNAISPRACSQQPSHQGSGRVGGSSIAEPGRAAEIFLEISEVVRVPARGAVRSGQPIPDSAGIYGRNQLAQAVNFGFGKDTLSFAGLAEAPNQALANSYVNG